MPSLKANAWIRWPQAAAGIAWTLTTAASKSIFPAFKAARSNNARGRFRCMGEDCITVNRTQSQDFTKAVALLNTAQQMAMNLSCDYSNASLQQKDPGTCEVFKGQGASCKMVGGAGAR